MDAVHSGTLLSLPARVLEQRPTSAIRDAVDYFEPAVIAIPGSGAVKSSAKIRELTSDIPVWHPQLGRHGHRMQHVRFGPEGAVQVDSEPTGSAKAIDLIGVQTQDVLDQLHEQLRTGPRETIATTPTFVFVPQLSIDRNTTRLKTTLPNAAIFAGIAKTLPEEVIVLAGEMAASYHHRWSMPKENTTVEVPVVGLGGNGNGAPTIGGYTMTEGGAIGAETVEARRFGLQAIRGVGPTTADRLRAQGHATRSAVRDLSKAELTTLPGIGEATAEKIQAHADVVETGEPLVLTNKTPVRTDPGTPPLCLDIETDGLSPTIIWQIGVYDPETDSHRAFLETEDPDDPGNILGRFMNWLLANHPDRTLLTWNGDSFDYRYLSQFIDQLLPAYADAWQDQENVDLYTWAVREENALLPGRTNKLDHVARALGYESLETGLSGAQTAAAYQAFMRNPDDPDVEPTWNQHRKYCEDDCRALWHVYRCIRETTRREVSDRGSNERVAKQAGLTEFTK